MEENTAEFYAALEILAENEKQFIVKEEKYDGVKYNSPELCHIRDALTYYDIPSEELNDYQDEGDGITAYDSDGFISWKENINEIMDEVVEYCDARDSDADDADDVAKAKFSRLSREDLDHLADICENACLYKRDKDAITDEDIANVQVTDELLKEVRLKIKQDVSKVKILAGRVNGEMEIRQNLKNSIKNNEIEQVETMLSQGATVNNILGQESLRDADTPEMIKLLVNNGARIENSNDASYDDDARYHSFLVDAISEARADKVAAYLQCGADVNFDESLYYGCEDQSVDLALKAIEKNNDKETVEIIRHMIEDARNGKPREEIRLEDYQNALKADEQKQTEKGTTPIRTENGRLLYSPEFETRDDVIKVALAPELNMYFVPTTNDEGQQVYEFCSKAQTEDEKKIQAWCESVKNPKLSKDLLFHVARDAVLVGVLGADFKQKKIVTKNADKPLKSMMQLTPQHSAMFGNKTVADLESVAKFAAKEEKINIISNEDKIAKLRHQLAGERLLIVADDFDAQHPLDTVVKTSGGKTSYGYIPEEIASKLGTKPAPVIVTEELFDHLDVKGTRIKTVADRGFNDMRDAVEYALQKPETLALGGGDGSFNIFFRKEGFDKGLMYANLMYSNEPVPAYIVRSISPTGKVKGDMLFEGENIPSMAAKDDKAFEEKIKSSAGERVTGVTWNKGNVMKTLRMHAQEGKYPTAEEFATIKQWIADGKTDHLTSGSVGMYIKQALEQPNCAMFFEVGQECGVWGKVAPEIEYVTTKRFLETMERAEKVSPEVKSAIILASMAVAAPEDKRSDEVKRCSVAFGLQGKEIAIALMQGEKGLREFDPFNAEKAYRTVESIVGNKFENTQILDDVLDICKLKDPKFPIAIVKPLCHLVIDAVKEARAEIDIKSMSPEDKKAYFSNKAAYDIAAVEKAFKLNSMNGNSHGPRE